LSDKRIAFGKKGEDLAAAHLTRLGYQILARNYRQRRGEIDIIARDGDCTVFIEVKSRVAGGRYSPGEAVTVRKRMQIARVAQMYLAAHRLLDRPARFDVIAVLIDGDGGYRIDHIPNAFDLPDSCF
jgi:putative endonuclease